MSRPEPAGERPRSHLAVGAYLTFVMAVGSFPAFAIGALAPFIVSDLDLSRTALGSVSTGMLLVATIMAPLIGVLSDRFSVRGLTAAALALATVSIVGMAAAPSIQWLVAAGCAYGLTCGAVIPVTNRFVARNVRPAARGRIMGSKASGVQAGALLAGLTLPSLALVIGWRWSLLVSAVAIVVGAVLGRNVMAARNASPPSPPAVADRPGSLVARLTVYAGLMGFAVSATATYLVLYGVEELRLHETAAGLAAALLGLAGIVSRLLWTELSERAGAAYLTLLLLPLGGVCSVALVWAADGLGVALFWAGAFAFGATAVAWNAVANLALLASAPGAVSGRVSGIMQAGFYAGYALAPVSVGVLLDHTGSYSPAWAAVAGSMAVAALWLFGWGRIDRRRGWQLL